MDNSSNYADLLEAGLRKKKKKMARGEITTYDPDRAKKAKDKTDTVMLAAARKRLGMRDKSSEGHQRGY